ncbi:MAG: GDP-mannose 4,6-dehydratase, partial [Kiritimatiellae bacterium]|nr:GDP-mannose 4,6-dehydratase [Kiritimatiellia bacterium]
GKLFTVYGDGEQTRTNTFVADAVQATLLAFEKREAALGQVFNVGGGEILSLNEAIRILEDVTGRKAVIERAPARPGDQKHTAANVEKARRLLGYNPAAHVADGLRAQVEWQRAL